MTVRRETELKFDCGPEFQLPEFDGLITVWDQQRRLTASYWDTNSGRLIGAGATLRHRSASDSSEEGWTLKLPVGRKTSAGVVRDEHSEPGRPDSPPARLVGLVRALTFDEPLSPVATIVTDRRSIALGTGFAEPVVEIADDMVESRVGGTVGRAFRQIEVELVEPSGTDVMKVASRALRAAGLRQSKQRSKLQQVLGPPPPSGFSRRALDENSTIAEAIAGLVARNVRQLVANDPAVRLGDDMVAVHQARVATRRLRAELRLFRSVLETDVIDELRTDLRWLGGLLGALRDTQVMTQLLDAHIQAIGNQREADGIEIAQRIAVNSEIQRTQLISALSGNRYLELLRRLENLVGDPRCRIGVDPQQPALPVLARRAARSWRNVRRLENRLGPAPTDDELHSLRKAIKVARYAAQAAGRLGAASRGFAQAALVLQDELGELHDCVVEMAWLDQNRTGFEPGAAFLAGRLHAHADQRRRELHTAWHADWDRLDRRRLRYWM